MRLRGRQARFLLLVLACWTGARLLALWPGRPGPRRPAPVARRSSAPPRARYALSLAAPAKSPARSGGGARFYHRFASSLVDKRPRLLAAAGSSVGSNPAEERAAPAPDRPAAPAAAAPGIAGAARAKSRWAASAYLFARPGGGRASLAAAGELGGSQAAARITYRLNREGPVRTALAARLYAPLDGRGAEAAAGLDWHPLPDAPLRVSIERRVALDRAGRNAWSAYAAGGFYREPLHGLLVLDGYAQAGVVGTRRRDLFVDGALRAGRKLALGPATAALGAGLWGAAQPSVARLDAGPRAAATLPVAGHALSAALEGRLRVAGRASPGSGVALTLGVDF